MKRIFRFIVVPLALGMAVNLMSCDDDTAFIGSEIMPGGDNVSTSMAEFNVLSRSFQVDSVTANTNDCFLGSVVDPETRAKTECGFLAQFHVMDNYQFPDESRLIKDEKGNLADSCDIRISFSSYYGDSLATMKLHVAELDTNKVMEENSTYYTNFNPSDFINEQGVKTSLAYSIKDLTRPDAETNGGQYLRSVIVRLPKDYGTYIIKKYYENPSFFKNSFQFIRHVCAGFYFNTVGSVGSMINAEVSTLNVYFRYRTKIGDKDTIVDGMQRMGATEEVIQSTRVENRLSEDMLDQTNPFTYLKTPTGIFTEVTLPVGEVVAKEHYTDTINGAKINFRKHNSTEDVKFKLNPPSDVLMVRKTVAAEFFEKKRLPEVKDSYLTSYNGMTNSYMFPNISQMLTAMKLERDHGAGVLPGDDEAARNAKYSVWEKQNPDWNKVLLIPVKADYNVVTDMYGYTTKKLLQVRNEMGLNSVKLEGGTSDNLKMTVIYSRFEK